MSEIKLTIKELNDIHSEAAKKFSHNSMNRDRNFLVECILESFLEFTAKNGYNVENGQIYKNYNGKKV